MDILDGKQLVIFGGGYIGGEVARQAIARGIRVTALTRNVEKASALKVEGVHSIVADLASDSWHADVPRGADFVLDAVSSGGGGIDGYRHSYIEGMQSIFRWAAGSSMGTFVYTSSTSVYPQDQGARVNELSPTTGVGELPQILLDAEGWVQRMATPSVGQLSANGPSLHPFNRTVILRLAGIYGPGRHHLIDQVRSGAVSGRGDHHLNLAHRDDITAAIWAVFAAPSEVSGGIFNVVDDRPALKTEIVTWLAEQLGVPVPHFTGAAAPGRRAITPDRIIENAKLKRTLGWQPRFSTYREGYKNMLAPRSE